jgi:putative transposase
MKLLDAIINNKQESRREWILNVFEKYGKANSSNHRFQVWSRCIAYTSS